MSRINNIKTLLLAACIGLCSSAMVSCSDDEDPALPGHGITEAQWNDINDVSIDGKTLIYEFEAPARWTASASEPWCELLTTSGFAGTSSLRVKVAPNVGEYGRSTDINIQVEGYSQPCVLTIRQGEGFLEKGQGLYRDVNQWVYEFMNANYLWNDRIPELTLDYSLDYQKFLTSMLDGIAKFDDINHDDGFWLNGQRQSYYTFIESKAPLSRAVGSNYTDSGLMIRASILGPNDDDPCGFTVMWVTPGSPGDEAGVQRGDFISKVNNTVITPDNYQVLGGRVLNGNVTIDLNNVEFNNGVATISPRVPSVLVGKDTYVDPAIYKNHTMVDENGKRIGYILYMGFNMDFDDELLAAFNQFKADGVEELVIDLRYNNGGHVLSSAVLGTLVAGSAHKDEIYVRTVYNTVRTAAGEQGIYRIGNPGNPESNKAYEPIATALSSALNLKRVFVITSINTASASELLINGLRGLGITVNLIGTTTQGKNVGMEGWQKQFGSYSFVFYPITFYCENGAGFRDYADGFKPELEFDDTNYYPGDFGSLDDPLSGFALTWASTGVKPNAPKTNSRSGKNGNITVLPSPVEFNEPMTRRLGGSIMMHND